MAVRIEPGGPPFGDFTPVAMLFLRNIGTRNFDQCVVEMTEFSRVLPKGLPMPLALRTQGQIRANERGRFLLPAGQEVPIPLAFYRPRRANEWYLFDDTGKHYFFRAHPTKTLLRIYGGPSPGSVLPYIDVDTRWRALTSVETVPSEFSLQTE